MIAPWIPILCSFSSCIVSGLTSFGDAIFFHIVWAIATASGGVPDGRDSLAKAVIFASIQSISNIPLLFWFARKELFRAFPYGAVMAISGCAMVPVGSSLLYFGDIVVVKWLAGGFFLAFSIWRLVSDGLAFVKSRTLPAAGEQSPSKAAAKQAEISEGSLTDSCTTPVDPETAEATVGGMSVHAAPDSSVAVAPPNDPAPAETQTNNFIDNTISRLLPISDRLPKKKCLLVLLCAGLGAGFLGGLLGTAGPPQMIAFSLMALHKDIIRAVSASYNSIEIPFRVIIFMNTDGTMFDFKNEWQLYLGIVLAAWTGYSAGTYLRKFADTAMIIRFLLCLVFASSGILLGALEHAWLAAMYIALAISFAVIMVSMVFYPENWSRFVHKTNKKATPEIVKAIHTSEPPATVDAETIVTVDPSNANAQ